MAIISFREYARQKGVNLKAIQKRIENGSITRNAIVPPLSEKNPGKLPKIDSEIADKDFHKNGDPQRRANAPIQQAQLRKTKSEDELKRQTPKTVAPKPEVVKEKINGQEVPVVKEPAHDHGISRLTTAKSISEELRSRKIELEVMELEGRLVDVNDVKEKLESKVSDVRAALFSAGDRLALQVLGKKDLLEVKTIIKSALNEALSGLQRVDDDF